MRKLCIEMSEEMFLCETCENYRKENVKGEIILKKPYMDLYCENYKLRGGKNEK